MQETDTLQRSGGLGVDRPVTRIAKYGLGWGEGRDDCCWYYYYYYYYYYY